jgi:transglutaminase-like putative cysteine protease
MIKKSLNLTIVLFAIVLKPLYPQSIDSVTYSFYHIIAKEIDLNSVNSFPQKIVKINLNESPFDLIIKSHRTNLPVKRFNSIKTHRCKRKTSYPEDINKYLNPTELIESESPIISLIIDSLTKDIVYTYNLIDTILNFVSSSIDYDDTLAKKISKGENYTQSALKTLNLKRGTCSEYTNLFLALVRNAGIPGRFVIGKILLPDGSQIYHAWAECYLEGIGWMPVEVQNGNTWIPDWGIKLFTGKDFKDCNITLPEIEADIKKFDLTIF